MLSKYYRLGEWLPQGRLSGESLHYAKITKQKTHPHAFLFASKSCIQKTKRYQKAFSKGLQVQITPHWQCLHGFGLAVREQWKIRHMEFQIFFFLSVLTVCLFPCKRDNHAWWTEMRVCSPVCNSASRQTRLWMTVLALKWLLFSQAKRKVKMETLYTSACRNPPLPCNYRDGELGLSTGVHMDICTVDKMFGEPWAPTISHDGMRKLHTVVTAPLTPRKHSPGWVFQSW